MKRVHNAKKGQQIRTDNQKTTTDTKTTTKKGNNNKYNNRKQGQQNDHLQTVACYAVNKLEATRS